MPFTTKHTQQELHTRHVQAGALPTNTEDFFPRTMKDFPRARRSNAQQYLARHGFHLGCRAAPARGRLEVLDGTVTRPHAQLLSLEGIAQVVHGIDVALAPVRHVHVHTLLSRRVECAGHLQQAVMRA